MEDYTYLGTIMTNINELRAQIKKRIKNANRAYYALLPVLKCQQVLGAGKIKIHKTLIAPVTTYRAQS